MVTGLELRVDKYLGGRDIAANGVVANVYALYLTAKKYSLRNVVVPIGSGANFKQIVLPPGRYLAEVTLPSGESISDEATVLPTGWTQLTLRGESSAHEWHSWQNLVGNVEAREPYQLRAATGGRALPPEVWTVRAPIPELQSGSRASQAWDTLDRISEMAQGGEIPRALTQLSTAPIVPNFPYSRDERTEIHEFLTNARFTDFSIDPPPRWYACIKGEDALELVSLPAPWFDIKTGMEVGVEMLIRQSPSQRIDIGLSVVDQYLGTALGYMANGALHSARQLTEADPQALQMLFQKWSNPLGAAAGGYILLATESNRERKTWHPWILNLSQRFKWLPDGAILEARHWLRQGSSGQNLQRAYEALSTAYRRGLPYFSLGLQWMLDGLTLVCGRFPEAEQMMASVQRNAWRINTSQPFTSVSLAQPFKSRGTPFKAIIESGSGGSEVRHPATVTA